MPILYIGDSKLKTEFFIPSQIIFIEGLPKMERSGKRSKFIRASRTYRAGGARVLRRRTQGAIVAIRAQNRRVTEDVGRSAPMRSTMAPEKKVLDLAFAAYPCDTTGSVTLLNGIAAGDDFNQRDGRKIKITDVQIQGMVSATDASTDDTYCLVMLVYDKQPNEGLATIAQIFSQANSTSFMNLNNRERFKILSTDRVALSRNNATATTAVGSCNQTIINRYIKTELVTVFDAATGAITDITHGAVLLVTLGDVAVGSGGSYFASTRVRFTEV